MNAQDDNGQTALMFAMYGLLAYDYDTDRGFHNIARSVGENQWPRGWPASRNRAK